MQEAIGSMARQQRLPGPSMYGSASYSGYPGVPSLGVPVPGPGFLPQRGPFSGSLASAPRNKQFKTKPSKVPTIAIQPQPQSSRSGLGPLDTSTASSSNPSSDLQLLLRARPQDLPSSDRTECALAPSSETGASAPAQPQPTAPRRETETWFNYSNHHDSTKSIYDEFQRFKRELQARLAPKDGGKHKGRQRRRQSFSTEKHISEIRKMYEEVIILKDQLKQARQLSEDDALEEALKEMDALVKFNSNKGIYTFPQAKVYRLKLTKEREEENK
ncbi:MAG: hypothetical protein J3R72DRAFT_420058 [Linnemannia gamsii]|nr:MAG: hypothetical protein J3R72DRAFT_420058 [Linnemannia gamsii]